MVLQVQVGDEGMQECSYSLYRKLQCVTTTVSQCNLNSLLREVFYCLMRCLQRPLH